ncbi:hypothetical protein M422DRAFT_150809, partial [Sphaerobolus stellatus SS14]
MSRTEILLQNILRTLIASEYFSSAPTDGQAQFWTEYERIARRSDDDFLERYNGDLDVQLIFAGLFSAVSSTFLVDMKADLQPDPLEKTNALLALIGQGILNSTFSANDNAILNTPIVPAKLFFGYLSLSLSLLAAFGAVLGKQW